MSSKDPWRHGFFDATKITEQRDAIVIFDDGEVGAEDQDAIYARYGDHLSPCRTVDRNDIPHWTTVMLAWMRNEVVEDRRTRTDRRPLPNLAERAQQLGAAYSRLP